MENDILGTDTRLKEKDAPNTLKNGGNDRPVVKNILSGYSELKFLFL
jgi:hypothetical protein